MDTSFQGTSASGKNEWLTPPELIRSLGEFDLDPCAPIVRPWDTAKNHYTINDDGLKEDWHGLVYCNPPYDHVEEFLRKCAIHNNAIALVYARTETNWFKTTVWDSATAVLFLHGRIRFYHVNGSRGGSPGCGSVLIAYGVTAANRLVESRIAGKLIILKKGGE